MSWIGGLTRGRAPRPGPAGAGGGGVSSGSALFIPFAGVDVAALRAAAELERLRRIEASLAVILRLDVGDVQKAVAADAEIDEGGLNARLEIDHLSLVDVADVIVLAGPFDVELFEDGILDDRDPTLLGLRDVDQHFLLHGLAFLRPRRTGQAHSVFLWTSPPSARSAAKRFRSAGSFRGTCERRHVGRSWPRLRPAKNTSGRVSNRSPDVLRRHGMRFRSATPRSASSSQNAVSMRPAASTVDAVCRRRRPVPAIHRTASPNARSSSDRTMVSVIVLTFFSLWCLRHVGRTARAGAVALGSSSTRRASQRSGKLQIRQAQDFENVARPRPAPCGSPAASSAARRRRSTALPRSPADRPRPRALALGQQTARRR